MTTEVLALGIAVAVLLVLAGVATRIHRSGRSPLMEVSSFEAARAITNRWSGDTAPAVQAEDH